MAIAYTSLSIRILGITTVYGLWTLARHAWTPSGSRSPRAYVHQRPHVTTIAAAWLHCHRTIRAQLQTDSHAPYTSIIAATRELAHPFSADLVSTSGLPG